jgi:LuxR family maltose regulon positive regulatory protein
METSAAESQPIRIYSLGRFKIVLDGAPLRFTPKEPRKPLSLLKALLCAGGRGVSQNTLQDALWPEHDAWLARRALNTTVYRLRQLLRHKDALTLDDGRVALDPRLCWVDAWAFERAILWTREPAALIPALGLYGGPFLGDTDHPLALDARNRLRRRFIQAVLCVGQKYESLDDISAAIDLYLLALDADCTAEDVHQALMRCLLRQGKPAAVAAAYQRCRTLLKRYLATVPSPATERVYRDACPG